LEGKPRTARAYTPYVNSPLRDLGDAPACHLLALRERLAQLQAEEQEQDDTAPVFITMGVNDRSAARTTMLSRKRTIAARESAIR
jgi:hypothetical protein